MTTKKKNGVAAGSQLPTQPDPLPPQGAPTTPVGFAPPPKGHRHTGPRPTDQEVRDAADVASELTTSKTYPDDFGKRAPDPKGVAAALVLAKGWSAQLAAAEQWQAYAMVQRDAAWRAARQLMGKLTPEFKLADAHDPSIATKYPQTRDFIGVRAKAARRAATTRQNKKKAAAKKA